MARSVREIDRNEDKYVGIRFPLDHSPEGFFYKTKTVLEQSKANLQNLLLTTPGERIFQPNLGIGLRRFLFEPITGETTLAIPVSYTHLTLPTTSPV